MRQVREIAQDFKTDLRFQSSAAMAQEAAELFLYPCQARHHSFLSDVTCDPALTQRSCISTSPRRYPSLFIHRHLKQHRYLKQRHLAQRFRPHWTKQ
ncbi:hypothetical protein PAXRUDRAFT_316994 [Paxillus rubicundulus Ve08.2h10]|uniref:Histone H3 n=1 Tax=Paxillus rubicundulus Ve08.2h10 TaxID=930991 RepID=A0A0D0EAC3_9AGAM|nr:hypothetical protein PAXRUDRAFT_316994 [Paxillus rubicundulus Ve08.2h10]